MEDASKYTNLIRIDASGQKKGVSLPRARDYLARKLQESEETPSDRALQRQLWQDKSDRAAQLCLRCYISWQIERVCRQLTRQFGQVHGFSDRDLLPLVLDDTGRDTSYRPLGQQIAESFDPERGSLNAWTTLRVKHHSELNHFLRECGLYLVSDWAILNDTRPPQLQRILGEVFLATPVEIAEDRQLLDCYHAIYRRDRLQQRQGTRRCNPPTQEQLQRMGKMLSLPPDRVLEKLQTLADRLREYRVRIRQNNPLATSLDATPRFSEQLAAPETETDPGDRFLEAYRQQFTDCLDSAIAKAISDRRQKLDRRPPPKTAQFLLALNLVHCEGRSMAEIAEQVGLQAQYQVTRLLKLKPLRADIQHQMLNCLRDKVFQQAQQFTSRERLESLNGQIDAILTEQIVSVMETARSEVHHPKDRTPQSRFARHLCNYLHTLDQP